MPMRSTGIVSGIRNRILKVSFSFAGRREALADAYQGSRFHGHLEELLADKDDVAVKERRLTAYPDERPVGRA